MKKSARIFLVSHHEDPIVRFEPELAVECPPWLRDAREPESRGVCAGGRSGPSSMSGWT